MKRHRLLQIAAVLLAATRLLGQKPPKPDITVAADGSGQFRTVQDAVDAVPDGGTRRVVIRIAPGVYKQQLRVPKGKPPITFVGDDAANTILTFGLSAAAAGGTGKSPTTFILADNFEAENLTFENSFGTGSQAVALYVAADRVVFRKCRFLAWQDTLYAGSSLVTSLGPTVRDARSPGTAWQDGNCIRIATSRGTSILSSAMRRQSSKTVKSTAKARAM